MSSDFPTGITEEVGHRPWPLLAGPWIMTQSWHDLLFAHWPVETGTLRARVPSALELDLIDGQAWLGIVPFHMTNVALRGMPALPWVSAFPEVNVRTYVRVGGVPGVYFFSLDAANPVAVGIARTMLNLPYYSASMDVQAHDGWVRYTSRRASGGGPHADFESWYRPTGPVSMPAPGSLDSFLTERYCLYTVDKESKIKRLDIHHPPWQLQTAEATFETNSMADAAGIVLPPAAPLLHFARRQDMVAWAPFDVSDR